MNRQKAIRAEINEFFFDTQLEADTYSELNRLQGLGAIRGLQIKYSYSLRSHSGVSIAKYVADFRCLLATGTAVVVEAVAVETAIWNRTAKHFIADYPRVNLVVVKSKSQFPLELTTRVFERAVDFVQQGR